MPLTLGRAERRGKDRVELEIHSPEEAHQFVQLVEARNVENCSAVKAWRIAKQSTWLVLLVAAFLLFYLVSLI